MVDYLGRGLNESQPVTALAYFYFAFDRKEMQTVNALMRSLIFQLNAQSGNLYGPLRELHKKYQEGGTCQQPPNKELEKTLMSILSQISSIYIVFDAIDEALNLTTDTNEENQLLHFFERLLASRLPNVHISIASRVDRLLERVFDQYKPIKIHCTREMIDGDIALQVSR